MAPASRCAVIVTFGDAIAGTRECLDALWANTDPAVTLSVVAPRLQGGSTSDWLEPASRDRGWRLVRPNAWLCPNAQRNLALSMIPNSEFTAFVTNDTLVEPGWLDGLLRHAQFSGAALTAP